MTRRLEGLTALVTGAGETVGAAIAAAMTRAGARVMIADENLAHAEATTAPLLAAGHTVIAQPLSPGREEDWHNALNRIRHEWGGLNILVHAATKVQLDDLETLSLEDWRKMRSVNMDAAFLGCKIMLDLMRRSGSGSIILLSPIDGTPAHYRLPGYYCSKGGLPTLAQAIALHCTAKGYDVRCNAVRPMISDVQEALAMLNSNADTDQIMARFRAMIPLGQPGQSDEAIEAIIFLASPESKAVNGKELVLEGGMIGRNSPASH